MVVPWVGVKVGKGGVEKRVVTGFLLVVIAIIIVTIATSVK